MSLGITALAVATMSHTRHTRHHALSVPSKCVFMQPTRWPGGGPRWPAVARGGPGAAYTTRFIRRFYSRVTSTRNTTGQNEKLSAPHGMNHALLRNYATCIAVNTVRPLETSFTQPSFQSGNKPEFFASLEVRSPSKIVDSDLTAIDFVGASAASRNSPASVPLLSPASSSEAASSSASSRAQ